TGPSHGIVPRDWSWRTRSSAGRASRGPSPYPCLNSTRESTTMSDFDAVLERLVTDPAFKSALAADPATALAGYQLSGDEVELLRSQVSAGDAGERTVETRTSKASMMGLLGQLGGMGLGGHAPATEPPVAMGRGVSHEHFGPPTVSTGLEPLHNAPGQGHYGGLGERPAGMGPGDAGHYGPADVPA